MAGAIRGRHLALHILLVSKVFGTELPNTAGAIEDIDSPNDESFTVAEDSNNNPSEGDKPLPDVLHDGWKLHDDLMSGAITLNDVEKSSTL